MKLAQVRFTAGTSVHTHTVPSTRNTYTFKYYTGRKHYVPVSELEDIEYFEQHESFDVDWTPTGIIARAVTKTTGSVRSAIESLSYRDKQKLAKERGIKANQSEEKLEDELSDVADELAQQMEISGNRTRW